MSFSPYPTLLQHILRDDCLVITSNNLFANQLLQNILSINNSPTSLCFLLSNRHDEVLHDCNVIFHTQNRPPIHIIRTNTSMATRAAIFAQGGVVSISPQMLLSDLLNENISCKLITSLLLPEAELLTFGSVLEFILLILRDRQFIGKITAISSIPHRILSRQSLTITKRPNDMGKEEPSVSSTTLTNSTDPQNASLNTQQAVQSSISSSLQEICQLLHSKHVVLLSESDLVSLFFHQGLGLQLTGVPLDDNNDINMQDNNNDTDLSSSHMPLSTSPTHKTTSHFFDHAYSSFLPYVPIYTIPVPNDTIAASLAQCIHLLYSILIQVDLKTPSLFRDLPKVLPQFYEQEQLMDMYHLHFHSFLHAGAALPPQPLNEYNRPMYDQLASIQQNVIQLACPSYLSTLQRLSHLPSTTTTATSQTSNSQFASHHTVIRTYLAPECRILASRISISRAEKILSQRQMHILRYFRLLVQLYHRCFTHSSFDIQNELWQLQQWYHDKKFAQYSTTIGSQGNQQNTTTSNTSISTTLLPSHNNGTSFTKLQMLYNFSFENSHLLNDVYNSIWGYIAAAQPSRQRGYLSWNHRIIQKYLHIPQHRMKLLSLHSSIIPPNVHSLIQYSTPCSPSFDSFVVNEKTPIVFSIEASSLQHPTSVASTPYVSYPVSLQADRQLDHPQLINQFLQGQPQLCLNLRAPLAMLSFLELLNKQLTLTVPTNVLCSTMQHKSDDQATQHSLEMTSLLPVSLDDHCMNITIITSEHYNAKHIFELMTSSSTISLFSSKHTSLHENHVVSNVFYPILSLNEPISANAIHFPAKTISGDPALTLSALNHAEYSTHGAPSVFPPLCIPLPSVWNNWHRYLTARILPMRLFLLQIINYENLIFSTFQALCRAIRQSDNTLSQLCRSQSSPQVQTQLVDTIPCSTYQHLPEYHAFITAVAAPRPIPTSNQLQYLYTQSTSSHRFRQDLYRNTLISSTTIFDIFIALDSYKYPQRYESYRLLSSQATSQQSSNISAQNGTTTGGNSIYQRKKDNSLISSQIGDEQSQQLSQESQIKTASTKSGGLYQRKSRTVIPIVELPQTAIPSTTTTTSTNDSQNGGIQNESTTMESDSDIPVSFDQLTKCTSLSSILQQRHDIALILARGGAITDPRQWFVYFSALALYFYFNSNNITSVPPLLSYYIRNYSFLPINKQFSSQVEHAVLFEAWCFYHAQQLVGQSVTDVNLSIPSRGTDQETLSQSSTVALNFSPQQYDVEIPSFLHAADHINNLYKSKGILIAVNQSLENRQLVQKSDSSPSSSLHLDNQPPSVLSKLNVDTISSNQPISTSLNSVSNPSHDSLQNVLTVLSSVITSLYKPNYSIPLLSNLKPTRFDQSLTQLSKLVSINDASQASSASDISQQFETIRTTCEESSPSLDIDYFFSTPTIMPCPASVVEHIYEESLLSTAHTPASSQHLSLSSQSTSGATHSWQIHPHHSTQSHVLATHDFSDVSNKLCATDAMFATLLANAPKDDGGSVSSLSALGTQNRQANNAFCSSSINIGCPLVIPYNGTPMLTDDAGNCVFGVDTTSDRLLNPDMNEDSSIRPFNGELQCIEQRPGIFKLFGNGNMVTSTSTKSGSEFNKATSHQPRTSLLPESKHKQPLYGLEITTHAQFDADEVGAASHQDLHPTIKPSQHNIDVSLTENEMNLIQQFLSVLASTQSSISSSSSPPMIRVPASRLVHPLSISTQFKSQTVFTDIVSACLYSIIFGTNFPAQFSPVLKSRQGIMTSSPFLHLSPRLFPSIVPSSAWFCDLYTRGGASGQSTASKKPPKARKGKVTNSLLLNKGGSSKPIARQQDVVNSFDQDDDENVAADDNDDGDDDDNDDDQSEINDEIDLTELGLLSPLDLQTSHISSNTQSDQSITPKQVFNTATSNLESENPSRLFSIPRYNIELLNCRTLLHHYHIHPQQLSQLQPSKPISSKKTPPSSLISMLAQKKKPQPQRSSCDSSAAVVAHEQEQNIPANDSPTLSKVQKKLRRNAFQHLPLDQVALLVDIENARGRVLVPSQPTTTFSASSSSTSSAVQSPKSHLIQSSFISSISPHLQLCYSEGYCNMIVLLTSIYYKLEQIASHLLRSIIHDSTTSVNPDTYAASPFALLNVIFVILYLLQNPLFSLSCSLFPNTHYLYATFASCHSIWSPNDQLPTSNNDVLNPGVISSPTIQLASTPQRKILNRIQPIHVTIVIPSAPSSAEIDPSHFIPISSPKVIFYTLMPNLWHSVQFHLNTTIFSAIYQRAMLRLGGYVDLLNRNCFDFLSTTRKSVIQSQSEDMPLQLNDKSVSIQQCLSWIQRSITNMLQSQISTSYPQIDKNVDFYLQCRRNHQSFSSLQSAAEIVSITTTRADVQREYAAAAAAAALATAAATTTTLLSPSGTVSSSSSSSTVPTASEKVWGIPIQQLIDAAKDSGEDVYSSALKQFLASNNNGLYANEQLQLIIPPDRAHIWVDNRELRAELVLQLYKHKMHPIVRKFEAGDYVLLNGAIGLERKAPSDLFGSLINGRLYAQMVRMAAIFTKALVMVEWPSNETFLLFRLQPLVFHHSLFYKDAAASASSTTLSNGQLNRFGNSNNHHSNSTLFANTFQTAASPYPISQLAKCVMMWLIFPSVKWIWSHTPSNSCMLFQLIQFHFQNLLPKTTSPMSSNGIAGNSSTSTTTSTLSLGTNTNSKQTIGGFLQHSQHARGKRQRTSSEVTSISSPLVSLVSPQSSQQKNNTLIESNDVEDDDEDNATIIDDDNTQDNVNDSETIDESSNQQDGDSTLQNTQQENDHNTTDAGSIVPQNNNHDIESSHHATMTVAGYKDQTPVYEQVYAMLQSFPGIGWKNANRTLRHFTSLRHLLTASKEDLISVLGKTDGLTFWNWKTTDVTPSMN